jgi:sulfocyanin SoxE-like protein
MRNPTTRRLLLAAALIAPVAAACTESGGDADVQVSLRDDAVALEPDSGAAGALTFAATNDGTETHEIEIFSGDVDPSSLPIEGNVASTEGLELVDEIEDITPGSSADLTVDLEAGTYVVMCNLPGHFANGMYASFEVA